MIEQILVKFALEVETLCQCFYFMSGNMLVFL